MKRLGKKKRRGDRLSPELEILRPGILPHLLTHLFVRGVLWGRQANWRRGLPRVPPEGRERKEENVDG